MAQKRTRRRRRGLGELPKGSRCVAFQRVRGIKRCLRFSTPRRRPKKGVSCETIRNPHTGGCARVCFDSAGRTRSVKSCPKKKRRVRRKR